MRIRFGTHPELLMFLLLAVPLVAGAQNLPPQLVFQRVWEPNERAFSVLAPKEWKTEGGIFNVNPLKVNGPGNTISPKCDFTIRSDETGSVMIRWLPSWNYADLSQAPMGSGMFVPGQFYQGMPVRNLVGARQFLNELLRKERPFLSEMSVIAEDPMREVTAAYERRAEQLNLQLRIMGIRPITFESLALMVEYTEKGRRFRECLTTTIADSRAGAFMWCNDHTVTVRAPAGGFETWKPILDIIQASMVANPQWLAAVAEAMGQRARDAWETQQYINRVAMEIVANRQKTNAEIRYNQYLFISGQEQYKNPFSGASELGSSKYRYRWQNRLGEVLYSDDTTFDPNRVRELETQEWRLSEVSRRTPHPF